MPRSGCDAALGRGRGRRAAWLRRRADRGARRGFLRATMHPRPAPGGGGPAVLLLPRPRRRCCGHSAPADPALRPHQAPLPRLRRRRRPRRPGGDNAERRRGPGAAHEVPQRRRHRQLRPPRVRGAVPAAAGAAPERDSEVTRDRARLRTRCRRRVRARGDPLLAGAAARSLEMWRRFFSNGEVYAADYSPLRARCLNWWREVVTRGGFADDARGRAFYEGQWNGSGRPRVLWLDQGDRDSLGRVAGRVGDLDVVIDDGSHRALHMINTFEVFFPKLRPGGVYIVEDLEANFITNPKEETGLSNASGGRRLFGARAEAAAEQRRDEIRSRRTMVDYLANLTLDLSFPYYRGTDVGQHPEHVQNSHALWVGSVECARYICAVRKRHHPFRPPRWFVSNPSRWGDMPMHMWPKYVLRSMRPGWNKGKRGIPRQVKELYRIKISSLYPCPRDCRTGVCSCTFSFLRPANVSDRGEAAAEGSAEDAR
eukprot:TRINITY_DN24547_c0_g1_i2.p1 TRINITY_DN24547_c0_g1~~TRINITY_DN24547_c0_g1_i2.p1  ORF type:complete len:509 (+),score=71.72 TRINITY_DN24547_c0_g1_i2:79-1527(+)